jgi:hypothetical protein
MTATVCLAPAKTIRYPQGGGHFWVYLNWALALRAVGCKVIWLEGLDPSGENVRELVGTLEARLDEYGFRGSLALFSLNDSPLPADVARRCLDLDAAAEADLLLNLWHSLPPHVVARFRRSAFVDTDPGTLQIWMANGHIRPAQHDIYFTVGETIGTSLARSPDCGLRWHYTPPAVFLPEWPSVSPAPGAPYTTVAHWWGGKLAFSGKTFSNEKRAAFLQYAELPSRAPTKLELALNLGKHLDEWRDRLEPLGWRLREAWRVTSTPEQYRAYIQGSRGEFTCARPGYVLLVTSWMSDRTVCYLASGKPAVVQYTGPSRFLPNGEGLFRFRTLCEASEGLSAAEAYYERHCRLARQLAQEYFDGTRVVTRVLERVMDSGPRARRGVRVT